MATQVRTVNFLPEIFQTETNKQFLDATLDILTSQPTLKQIQGYIGNKFQHGINRDETYVTEPDKERTDYQLNPSVVFCKSETQIAQDFISYPGIVKALANYGAATDNHQRLFENDFYSWDPFIDLDKIVNYTQYYWIPNGPDAVPLTTTNVNDIIGQSNYVSPNGVKLTNGLKISFSESVIPSSYSLGSYYVDGVGSSIVLLPAEYYLVPEPTGSSLYLPWDDLSFDTTPWDVEQFVPVNPEYITISRNSRDYNAWSRSNRWFHQDVLTTTEKFLGYVTNISGNDITRAQRPIIEYRGNLQLINTGTSSVGPISMIDTSTTDALSSIAGQTSYSIDGIGLANNQRIVFAADNNLDVRKNVYIVNFVPAGAGGENIISLTVDTSVTVTNNSQFFVLTGQNYRGTSWRWSENDLNWDQAQQKNELNQYPLFDLFDINGVSFTNNQVYPGTTFKGNYLFSFTPNTNGVVDPILGFPIKYSEVNNIGDINFTVNFNSDSFNFIKNNTEYSSATNSGYVHYNTTNITYEKLTGWVKAAAPSIQYQIFNFLTDNLTNTFTCDVAAKSNSVWQNVQVFINDDSLDTSLYTVTITENTTKIVLNSAVPEKTRVSIFVYSDQVSNTAFYQIPDNLQNNPFNVNITTVDVGDLRNQYRTIFNNYPGTTGQMFGNNNLHDLPDLNRYGTSIIQNSASLVLPGLFLRKDDVGFFQALEYNCEQYQLYKNLLIDLATKNDYSIYQTPAQVLDSIIYEITTIKNSKNSFFWTDMLFSGSPLASNIYSIEANTDQVIYNLNQVYNFKTANYNGIGIYLTRTVSGISKTQQLLRGIDYTVSETSPNVMVHMSLLAGDTITVNEYNQTYGTYCPSTPSSLGLYPVYVPEVYLDYTTNIPTYILRGHDGSYNKLFGSYNDGYLEDFRDIALFEFEKRVFNNIKIDSEIPLNYYQVQPGQFRTTEYTYEEMLNMYRSDFLSWVGQNRVDYRTQVYSPNNSYTFNYNQSSNKLSSTQEKIEQGYWRGIFRWLYDTEDPSMTPWEMLGFSIKPDWWNSTYGAAPYSSTNLLLWNDLKEGIIRFGPRENITDNRYLSSSNLWRRPRLLEVLPVDSSGYLLSPFDVIVSNYNSLTFKRSWTVGDCAPTEASFLHSSTWPFKVMRLLALTKPAKFFNLFADRDRYVYNREFEQYLYDDRYHLDCRNLEIYGNGTAKNSYINWIVDYVNQRGVNGSDLVTAYLKNLDVRLTYNLSGFSGKNYLKFYIERATPNSKNTSLLIPDENYSVLLYNNVTEDTIKYSSVIIQRTEDGWTIWGNSQSVNYFTTTVPKPNGNIDFLNINGTSVKISKDWVQGKYNIVPYGTLFYSQQALCDFLNCYGQYLITQGVKFENIYDNVAYDWNRMIQEYVVWSNQNWEIGSTIALNPNARYFTVNKEGFVVQPLTISDSNFILNQNLLPVKNENSAVIREKDNFSVKILNEGDTVSYTNLNVNSIEHAIVFDNITSFNDLIYNTTTGLRQTRLLLKGFKTADWVGYINANGFILSEDNIKEWASNIKYAKGSIVTYKSKYWVANELIEPENIFPQKKWKEISYDQLKLGLLPNPSTQSAEALNFYNSNIANLENDVDLLSFSLIGYRPRDYLAAADLSDITQINIFKNIIREKGTALLAESFKFASFPQGVIDYNISENWALNIANFGAVLNSNYVEARLQEYLLIGNPTMIGFSESTPVEDVQQTVLLKDLVNWERPPINENFLPKYLTNYSVETGLPTAGYVNSNDVKFYVYNYNNLNAELAGTSELFVNDNVWIANINSNWNVFSAQSLNTQLIQVQNNQNGTTTFIFADPHNLQKNDRFLVTSFYNGIDNFYTVDSVDDIYSVTSNVSIDYSILKINGEGVALKLDSRRYYQASELHKLYMPYLGLNERKAWIDSDSDGTWAVYGCNPVFIETNYQSSINAGSSVAYNKSSGYLFGNSNTSLVYQVNNSSSDIITLGGSTGFGKQIVTTKNNVFITSNDAVYFYTINFDGSLSLRQIILNNTIRNIAASDDGIWLYVTDDDSLDVYLFNNSSNLYELANTIAAPVGATNWGNSLATSIDGTKIIIGSSQETVNGLGNAGAVYVYSRLYQRFISDGTTSSYTIVGNIPNSKVRITVDGVLVTDYTLSGNIVTFTGTVPIISSVITVSWADIVFEEKFVGTNIRAGMNYANSVDTNRWGSDFVVGAPEAINTVDNVPNVEGTVYVYTNSGQKYGIITAVDSSVNSGDVIYINGYAVTFPFTTNNLNDIADEINVQTPTNIRATVSDNALIIDAIDNSVETINNIIDLVADKTTLDKLKISLYTLNQQIFSYDLSTSAKFGFTVKMNERDGLVIGAPTASMIRATTFDFTQDNRLNDTIFDNNATSWNDEFANVGLAYLYEYLPAYKPSQINPNKYVFAQYINSSLTSTYQQPNFGYAVSYRDDVIVVGAPNWFGSNQGTVISYSSNTTKSCWTMYRKPLPIVDINRINNISIYDSTNNKTLDYLDYIDPYQGKLLGAVAKNLNYVSANDPAGYENDHLQWGAEQIGQLWFDTTNYRLMNYSQDDRAYNAKNWGRAFPGSRAMVYTWIESLVPPLEYNGSGIVYSFEKYVTASVYDLSSNTIRPRFYFWVGNLNIIAENKTLSASVLSQYLLDPQSSGISFLAPITTNTVALYNCSSSINSNTSVLHIGYGNTLTQDVMHTISDLISSNNSESFLPGLPIATNKEPSGTYLKYIDSFCGRDSLGNLVPDPRLPLVVQSGINFRPRQTMFMNRLLALENFIDYANNVMKKYPITEVCNDFEFLNKYNDVNGNVKHPDCYVATTANLVAAYTNGASGVGSTLSGTGSLPMIDGISVSIGDRILVKNQLNSIHNGIYEVTQTTAPWILTRASDFNGSGSGRVQAGDSTKITHGATQSDTVWTVDVAGNVTFGSTNIKFKLWGTTSAPTIARPIYDVRNYWKYIDWWAPGYNSSTKAVIEVEVYSDLLKISDDTLINGVNGLVITRGDGLIAKVRNNGEGNSEWFEYTSKNGWTRIGVENGTIEILDTVYKATYGWDSTGWSGSENLWDQNQSIETRWIIRWINEVLYTNDLLYERNNSLMLMFNYIKSENIDQLNYGQWLTKTSFIDVNHKIRDLLPYKKFQRDNTEFLTGFIEEIKPYHVYVKNFIYSYPGEDLYSGSLTDFDLPAQYNSTVGKFETPQLVYENTFDDSQYPVFVRNTVGNISSTSTSIVLNSVTELPDTGILIIDKEQILYSSVDKITNTVTDLTRGYNNTVAANHISSSIVNIYNSVYTNLDYTEWFNNWGIHLDNQSRKIKISNIVNSITSTANSITLNNTYGLQSSGIIQINQEKIYYSSVNNTTNIISGLLRGYENTTASSHSANSSVFVQTTNVMVLDSGRGYREAPAIIISSDLTNRPKPREIISLSAETTNRTLTSVKVNNIGSGYSENPSIDVNPSTLTMAFTGASISTATNTIINSDIQLETGDSVKFISDSDIYGLKAGQYYYIAKTSSNAVALYTNRLSALSVGTPLEKIADRDLARIKLVNNSTNSVALAVTGRIELFLDQSPIRELKTIVKFDRITYTVDESAITPGLDSGDYNAAERIALFYKPTDIMPGKALNQLMTGTEYPNVVVNDIGYDFTSNIQYDVLVDGADFTDIPVASSEEQVFGGQFSEGFGPEELVPGNILDSVIITVTSNDLSGGGTWSYTIHVRSDQTASVYAGNNIEGEELDSEYYDQYWYSTVPVSGLPNPDTNWDTTMSNSQHSAAIFLKDNSN